jgi:hypothetical protein
MSPLIAPDPARTDRLYALLPTVHRMRDAERGYPLKALLRVIAEQVNVVEDDIAQLYENWFIETAEDWVVPYIGDLIGYRPAAQAGVPADGPACERARVLVPRREIAELIATRRRKGTLALLEDLADDVAQWPARAVEFFKLLNRTQNINHLFMHRHRLVDLRDRDALDRLDGPFDSIAHGVDVRRIDSNRTRGRSNIPSVGVFVWRLLSESVTDTQACCIDEAGPHCFTFSVLGQDAPLFIAPLAEPDSSHIAGERNVPAAIRRLAFDKFPGDYYGDVSSLSIRTDGWAGQATGQAAGQPVPVTQLLPADLSGWTYVPPAGFIAVDPVLGRLAFPPNQLPKKGVRVRYRYGTPAQIGGGEYARTLSQPPGAPVIYRVGDDASFTFHRIGDALAAWRRDKPTSAVIELAASTVYVEPLNIELGDDQSLQLRAANRTRPVLRLIDWQTDLPDALIVSLGLASRFTLDGLLITGRPVRVTGRTDEGDRTAVCPSQVVIRHCTLVPGWGIDCDCDPRRPAEPSLELSNVRARVRIEHSIAGSIQISEDEVRLDPLPLEITDSIVDATAHRLQAIGAPGNGIAHALLTIQRCTVFGIVDVHAMQLGENSLFMGCVNVARRQVGCMRYCFVPPGCRTPRRYHCEPDGVITAVRDRVTDPGLRAAGIASETLRVWPQFTAERYGKPAYAQLGRHCAVEITRGADDEAEMGVYHDLYQPQREASLRARLAEYTPAAMHVGLFFAN